MSACGAACSREDRGRTFAAGGELDIAALHPVELVFVGAGPLLALLDHRIPMRELAAEDVAEDLGVAVGVRGEAGLGGHSVFVEDAEGAKGHGCGVVEVGEGEGVVGIEPAMIGVPTSGGAARGDFGVG